MVPLSAGVFAVGVVWCAAGHHHKIVQQYRSHASADVSTEGREDAAGESTVDARVSLKPLCVLDHTFDAFRRWSHSTLTDSVCVRVYVLVGG
eukprot:46961-Eustigmatos_ZCMA.PRE.1